ncbi:MAG: hypothetical protein QOK37_3546 [Thermoanaerobaculia bacterium]|nr:hypothetical protein [Thermoanaerobaculia bacterium]
MIILTSDRPSLGNKGLGSTLLPVENVDCVLLAKRIIDPHHRVIG